MGVGARLVRYVAIGTSLLGVGIALATWLAFGPSTVVARYARAPTEADLPRTWFDARIDESAGEVCQVRKEVYTNKSWQVDVTYDRPTLTLVPTEAGPKRRVLFAELDVDARPSTDQEIERALDGARRPSATTVRFTTACARDGDRVRIDACVDKYGVLEKCLGDWRAGVVRPELDLRADRAAELRARGSASWLGVIVTLFLGSLFFAASKRAGHRLRPLLLDSRPRAEGVLAASVPVALATVAVALGAPLACLVLPIANAVPFAFAASRAAIFRRIISYLEAPPEGHLVLEGAVSEQSPVGASVVERTPAAVSFTAVCRIHRGKGIYYEPVGEVSDLGRLDVRVADATMTLDLEDAVLELVRDAEAERIGRELPDEIRNAMSVDPSAEYRVRESVLKVGDPICVLVEGARSKVEGSAYRAAPRGPDVKAGARPAVFEGSKADAVSRLERKARAVEQMAAVFGAIAMAGAIWALIVAWVVRS